jgi:hypothetical protein
MRSFLASSGLATIAVLTAAPAASETVISSPTTTPLVTSASGDIRITSTGSIKPTSGIAVTINSNNFVNNAGTIAVKGANGAVGIFSGTNVAGDITNSGTITIDEDFTPTDSDNDGDVDGPFAQGTGRFGIHVASGGVYGGSINHSGTITVEGNQSAAIAVDSQMTSYLTTSGTVTVTGDDSFGIRTAGVAGDVTIGSGSTTNVQGKNSVGVLLGGDVGGAVHIQGTVNATGYRATTAPADTSKLDADDLLQGGSAVVVAGNVGGGILLDARPADTSSTDNDEDDDGITDSNETTAAVTSFGQAPAMVVGSASQDVHIGVVAGSANGHGIVIKGTVAGNGVYNGVSATGLSIGGLGKAATVDGGMTVIGTVGATAVGASATGMRLGSGASVPQIVNVGTIKAEGGGASADSATAILIDSGAVVNVIANGGTIAATRTGDNGSAAAIVDRSGTLLLVQNSGQIGVTNSGLGDLATAIDLRANSAGATVRQLAAASGRPAPIMAGSILFGSGNDTLDIQAGSVVGKVDFGSGTGVLSLSGTGLFRGTLANSSGVAATVGTGATLDVQNLGTVNLASLTTAANSNIGVTVGKAGHTLYNVAGTAAFGTGTKLLVTLDHVGSAAGTYKIIDAATLTGGENLTSTIVTLPFLFNSKLTPDSATGEVALEVTMKSGEELQLNRSELAILDAATIAADGDRGMAAVFLNVADAPTLKSTLQQLMPDHAGGAFETAIRGSRLAAQVLDNPHPVGGLWMQQLAWGTSKSVGETSSYDLTSWGAAGGYDVGIGKLGSVGLTAGYFYGKDSHLDDQLASHHYEFGAYWRGEFGPIHGWARATAGTVRFDSTRKVTGTVDGGVVSRTAQGKWDGRLYSGSAGLSYEARMGRLSLRPNGSIEYYKLKEKAYTETGGGDAVNLTVASRNSDETAANLMLSLGYDLLGLGPDDTWLRVEIEGGRREILGGSLGDTVAWFKDGEAFVLAPEDRTSGWRGAVRTLGGGPNMNFLVEGNAEEQQGHGGIGARVGLNLAI